VAFTVPVWENPNEVSPQSKPIGVVGMVVDLKLKSHVEMEESTQLSRLAALIDTRPDVSGKRGLIVRHPYFKSHPPENVDQFVYADDIVRWSDEWRKDPSTIFPYERDYKDPIGKLYDDYGGEWLASVMPVVVPGKDCKLVDSGWVVLVQVKQDEVLAPVRDLEWRLGFGALAVLIPLVLIFLLLGVMSMMDRLPRFLRPRS
jgi:eukaryotic-like serine/threonine-protein kinase